MAEEVGNLTAKLNLDTADFSNGIKDAQNETSVFSDLLSANLATKAIGMAVDGLKKLGEAFIDTGKQAVLSYADYEQFTGGIETLFKDSSDTVLQYAEEAYKTAGISANQYMELATGFSGALIKSTGRGVQQDLDQMKAALDEELKATKRHLEDQYDNEKDYWDKKIKLATNDAYKQKLQDQRDDALKELKRSNEDQLAEIKAHNKDVLAEAEALNAQSVTTAESLADAAELTQTAIIDMADQANKYGKTVEEVSTTYMSLSRGIYSTLDNLFGGMFAGTKQGLQDMLTYAENYRKGLGETVSYSIDSYADIVSAIHDVSEALEISGTTSKEASDTISGSIGQMKAAWQNLIAGLGNDKADINKLLDEFIAAANNAADKIIPVAEKVLDGMIEIIIKGLPKFIELGAKIAGAILEGLAKILMLPALGVLKLLDYITGGSVGDLMSGRASGGPVQAGVPYMTGELGPELFIPSTNGYILNSDDTEDYLSSRGGVTININGDVYDDAQRMKQKMRTAVLGIMQEQVAYG